MLTPGSVSYLVAGAFFLVLMLLLITSWRGRLQGAVLVAATLMNTVWAFTLAYEAAYRNAPLQLIFLVEILRSAIWIIFLLRLLGTRKVGVNIRILRFLFYALLIVVLGVILVPGLSELFGSVRSLFIPSMLVMSVTGVILVEQLYRNTRADYRWAVKYLCIGLGGMFVYDLFLYSHGTLFQGIDKNIWHARGVINALVVPLIAVAAARNPSWSLDVFVSRKIVFYATGLIGIGLYLLAMSVGGYYISIYGGGWGTLAQASFLAGAILLLLIILFSGQSRARLKVFLSKHFYNYKYDYRDEWRRLIRTLSSSREDTPLRERTIKAVAQIVESPGGAIWTNQEGREFVQVTSWNFPEPDDAIEAVDGSLARFLEQQQWIIDIQEYRREPERYSPLLMPDWLIRLPDAWLIVPLVHEAYLLGFMVLSRPRAPVELTWEDYDMLKMVGSQAASYLTQYEANQELAQSRQFDAYNRLTAFIMHDLKNLILQQSLILKNAARHKDNAAFIETAFETIDNSVRRMRRLLEQLQRSGLKGAVRSVELSGLLAGIVESCRAIQPFPELEIQDEVKVNVDPERMTLVVGHLVRNAQEATPQDGFVRVSLSREGHNAVVTVSDNGSGMDQKFIRNRLFQPFDTTKGSKGMGIGVFQTREFARSMGGTLSVESVEGKGTTFRLVLPESIAGGSGRIDG